MCNFLDYKGSIRIDGIEIKDMSTKNLAKKITILPQKVNLYFDYKVYDFVRFGRYCHKKWGIIREDNEDFIIDILKKLDIYSLKDNYMSKLSGGECQRVFIARVFVQNSDIILFDEMNNNLDIGSQIYIVKNINDWFKDKILISVFHDLNLVKNLNSNVMVIKDSRVYRYGGVDEILTGGILKNIYGIDVREFMIDSLKKWVGYK